MSLGRGSRFSRAGGHGRVWLAWALSISVHATILLAAGSFVIQLDPTPERASREIPITLYFEPPPGVLHGTPLAIYSGPLPPETPAPEPLEPPKPPPEPKQPERSAEPEVARLVETVPMRLHAAEPPTSADSAEAGSGAGVGAGGSSHGGADVAALGVPGGTGLGPMRADMAARPPVVLFRATPRYPRDARVHHVEGEVLLEAVIDESGRVEEEIVVVRSVHGLDTAAIDALRRWRFAPARDRDGHPIRVIVRVPFRFALR